MVASRAAVVVLLAFLGAGCCCGPCGPCCGPCYGPPPCCSNYYQPCPPCYASPCARACPTCGQQFGWQQGYGSQMFGTASYPQYMTEINGTTAAMPTVAGGGGNQPASNRHLVSYSAPRNGGTEQAPPGQDQAAPNQQPNQQRAPSVGAELQKLDLVQQAEFLQLMELTKRYNLIARRLCMPELPVCPPLIPQQNR